MTKGEIKPKSLVPPLFKFAEAGKPFDLTQVLLASPVKIIHPCDAFAQSAGYANWASAVQAMREGKIATGIAPRVGKTTYDLQIFLRQIETEGLYSSPISEFGHISLGLKESFPPESVARYESEAAERTARFEQSMKRVGTK